MWGVQFFDLGLGQLFDYANCEIWTDLNQELYRAKPNTVKYKNEETNLQFFRTKIW